MNLLLLRQLARAFEESIECDKMIRDKKKRCELTSKIFFQLSTCNFKKHGVLQIITLLFAEFILV